MSDFNPTEREKLTLLLTDQLELVEQITKLCEKQGELLDEADKFDELNALLDEAEKLREKINGLHQEANPLMQSYVSSTQGRGALQQDPRIADLATAIQEKTEICTDINKKNMSALNGMLEGQKKKIDEKSAQRKGIGGYVQTITNTSEMFDRKT